jgi:hypothetical protein
MAAPPQFLYRDVSVHPPEADRLADKIAEFIRKLMSEQSKVGRSLMEMDPEWEGHQKATFFSGVNPQQKKGDCVIEYLKRQESVFRNLRVTVREAYTNPAWEAYGKGQR